MASHWAPYGDLRKFLGAPVDAKGHKKAASGPHSVSNVVSNAIAWNTSGKQIQAIDHLRWHLDWFMQAAQQAWRPRVDILISFYTMSVAEFKVLQGGANCARIRAIWDRAGIYGDIRSGCRVHPVRWGVEITFLDLFGFLFDRFGIIFHRFGIILGSIWDNFGIVSACFWDNFETLWDHFGSTLGRLINFLGPI